MQPIVFQNDAPLLALNTLALPAVARHLVSIDDAQQLACLRESVEYRGCKRLVLGGGSNIVFSTDFDGVVVKMDIRGRTLLGQDSEAWYVQAGAGENWHQFVCWTLQNGWPGLENLSLIPGTAGAAPIQNIGAYGLEVGERLHAVEAYDLHEGRVQHFDQEACRFGYRDSVFKREQWHLSGRFAITSVTFRLPKAWRAITDYADIAAELERLSLRDPTPQQVANAVIGVRNRKLPDPTTLPNAGSFFQNPVVSAETGNQLLRLYPNMPRHAHASGQFKLAAGWLIERAGWKGRTLGAAGMYEKQALILVNNGGACGQDIIALSRAVAADVERCFGIRLQAEPSFV